MRLGHDKLNILVSGMVPITTFTLNWHANSKSQWSSHQFNKPLDSVGDNSRSSTIESFVGVSSKSCELWNRHAIFELAHIQVWCIYTCLFAYSNIYLNIIFWGDKRSTNMNDIEIEDLRNFEIIFNIWLILICDLNLFRKNNI